MKRGLGRGLEDLLGAPEKAGGGGGGLQQMKISDLSPGRGQPRRHFDKEELKSMAESIRQQGIIQPVIVRPRAGGGYEIVAGERRWRAAQMAGLSAVPVAVRNLNDRQAMLFALAENIQRADLQPIEQAHGIQRLLDELAMTHEQAATALGMSRPGVSNLLRLLQLSPPVLKLLEKGDLDAGHARALLPLPAAQQATAARRAVAEKMSARQVENMVRDMQKPRQQSAKDENGTDADSRRLAGQLSAQLSARVQINHRPNGNGRLTIHYGSLESLERICKKLQK